MANAEVLNPGTVFGLGNLSSPQISPQGWFNQVDTTAQNPIGGKIRWGNIILRYVKIDPTDVVPTSGCPMYASTTQGGFTPGGSATAIPTCTFTADQSDSAMANQVMGVYGPFTITLPTTVYFTWVQVGGVANVISTGITAVGNVLIGSSTDLQFAVIADGSNLTNVPAARVCGASASGLAPALLMNMDW